MWMSFSLVSCAVSLVESCEASSVASLSLGASRHVQEVSRRCSMGKELTDGDEQLSDQRTSFEAAFDDYITFHNVNKTSSRTVTNYRNALFPFVSWLKESERVVYVDQLRVKHLRKYVSHLQASSNRWGRPFSDSSIRQYALAINIFCHWLQDEDLISSDATRNFDLPKSERKEVPALTNEDFVKLLNSCEEGNKHNPRLRKALTARNRAIVTVFFDSGIRLSELSGLRLGDVDRTMRLLYVKRKGGKWQQVPISYDGFKPLHEYITRHRSYLASLGIGSSSKRDDPVFLNAKGEVLTASGVKRLFERLRDRSGIVDKPVYSHQGRRYMATTQLNAGRNPLDVQRQMGHTTLMMTNRYYSQSVDGLSKSHEQYSPTRKKSEDTSSSGLGSGYYDG